MIKITLMLQKNFLNLLCYSKTQLLKRNVNGELLLHHGEIHNQNTSGKLLMKNFQDR